MAPIQETHLVCEVVARVLSRDFLISYAYENKLARDLSLLVKRTLGAEVNLNHVKMGEDVDRS